MRRAAAVATLVAMALAGARLARASLTQFWTLNRASDYREAELSGATVTPEGTLRAGAQVESADLPGAEVAWAIVATPDGVLAGTGPEGVVYRARPGGRVEVADSTGSGQVLCLTRDASGKIFAGTAPDGRVLAYDGKRFQPFFQTKDKYVWDLAWSGRTLFVVTGPEGYLYEITAKDRGKMVFHAPTGQLTAVAGDGKGGCFVGGSGRGAIYAYAGGRARSLFEAPETEIRSLVWQKGALYAAAVSVAGVRWDSESTAGTEKATPVTSSDARSVVYRIVPDSSAAEWWRSPQSLVFALAPRAGGGLWVATGSRAALYALDDQGRSEGIFAAAEGNATALTSEGSELWMATSNPSRLYRVRTTASSGEARSDVFDAGRIARWGRFLALGNLSGARFATRSGNTSNPDSTWSEWQGLRADELVPSPSARYLQWRVDLSGNAEVREVRIAYAEVNQAPHIDEFVVSPEPGKFYRGEITPRQDPVTQILPGGARVQYSTPSPPPGAPELLPVWARGLRPFNWKATDPNGDPMEYRLEFRKRGAATWSLIAEDIESPPYTWDTNPLEEGEYEVRLIASDRPREGEDALTDAALAGPVVVDHTPPTLSLLEARADAHDVIVRGEARDGGLYVSKVEVLVGDSEDWEPATAVDGLWDSPVERFTARVRGVAPGSYAVQVRAADAIGNLSVSTVHVVVGP
jgi:hypothetical protein